MALRLNFAEANTKLVFNGSGSPVSSGSTPYTIFVRARRDIDTGGREWLMTLGNGGAYAGFSANAADNFTKFDWNQGDATLGAATVGAWTTLAMTNDIENVCTAYHGSGGTLTAVAAAGGLGSALGLLTLGVYPFANAEYGRFSLDDLRIWSADLTEEELEAEDLSPVPVRTDDLWDAWEFVSGALLASASGTRNLTATGSNYEYVAGPISASGVTVTDAGDETFQLGESITITGTGFGATQGAGKVYLSPTNSIADSGKVEQTVTAWSATSITITVAKGTLPFGAAHLFVLENGGSSNASGHAVSLITRGAQRSMLLGLG